MAYCNNLNREILEATRVKGELLTAKIVDWISNWIEDKRTEAGVFHLFEDLSIRDIKVEE